MSRIGRSRARRWVRVLAWIAGVLVVLGIAAAILITALLRPEALRRRAIATLSKQLGSDVGLGALSVTLLPSPRVTGTSLTLRLRGREDLPPLIEVDRFDVSASWLDVIGRHAGTVHVDGLHVNLPPGARDLAKSLVSTGSDAERVDVSAGGHSKPARHVYADYLIAHHTTLTFIRRRRDQEPLVFAIDTLAMNQVGIGSRMPFSATLTNPIPEGRVDAHGSFGPWVAENPEDTPLDGTYVFSNANLDTINGIGGTLRSTGSFRGALGAIVAIGTSTTPDFSLDTGGKPLPLEASYQVLIDGTDGSVMLQRVDATLGHSPLSATGGIVNLPGPAGHRVHLHVTMPHGRIEDLLRLASDRPEPLMTGDMALTANVVLPPAKTPTIDRLELDGDFALPHATFTAPAVQEKLDALSRRSRGMDKDAAVGDVATHLRGTFTLRHGVLDLEHLQFGVPGARIAVRGTYQTGSGALNFVGTLRMDTTVSKAVGGFKSIFLKPFDGLFKKDGAGALVPIKITGTRDDPKVGIQFGKIFGG